MNEKRSRELRSIFRAIAPFSEGDPRNKASYRGFKRDYLSQPRPTRAAYMTALRSKVKELLPEEKVEGTVTV